jgi:dihydrofolate synthase/folylpolyglutamate synthase
MSNTIPDSIHELLAAPKFGKGIGFRRMQLLLQPLMESAWGRAFTTIRVTGSNGKGSVTAITHSLLRSLGVYCGRYTSPHLVRFNERIVIGDREVTDTEIAAAYSWMRQAIDTVRPHLRDDEYGSFELITALCAKCFYDAGVHVGVMETGIGGRYDTVRLFPGSLTALTSVDLEHSDLLGKTTELIAYDKIDLCPDGGTVVGTRRDNELWERIEAYCRVRRVNVIDTNTMWRVERVTTDGAESSDGMEVRLLSNTTSFLARTPLIGTFQLDNLAIACTLAELWTRGSLPDVSQEQFAAAVARGLREVHWPGRFERICITPPVWIDVGHSPDACSRLVETVTTFLKHQSILLVTGVSVNKAVENILKVLTPVAQGVICTRAYHMGERVDRIANIVRDLAPTKEVWEAPTIEEAAVLARQVARARGMTVLVAGGLFLAVEFRTVWEGSDPKQLQFY